MRASEVAEIQRAIDRRLADPAERVGLIHFSNERSLEGVEQAVALPADPRGYAHGLYAALHALDAAHCSVIVVEAPPEGEAWDAVRDRLGRATH
jgi:L-threonylcarbamoyladenylate synthase